jgi:DNA-binding transcriptional LysR family regulator
MELSQLRSVVAVSEHGSFRQAAAALQIAQPSLSQHIRRLELELGVQLFDRTRRPVTLSEPGRVLLERSEQILQAVAEARTEVRDFDVNFHGRVAVGAMQYLARLELPSLLATFRREHAATDLYLRIGNTEEIRELLVNGEIDIGLLHVEGAELPEGFATRKLRTERLVVIMSANDELTTRSKVQWRELADRPFITFKQGASLRQALIDAAGTAGFEPRATLDSADMPTAFALAEQGLGVALVPESCARQEAHRVASIVVGDGSLHRTVVLAWDARAYRSRAVAAFARLALQTFRPSAEPRSRQSTRQQASAQTQKV